MLGFRRANYLLRDSNNKEEFNNGWIVKTMYPCDIKTCNNQEGLTEEEINELNETLELYYTTFKD